MKLGRLKSLHAVFKNKRLYVLYKLCKMFESTKSIINIKIIHDDITYRQLLLTFWSVSFPTFILLFFFSPKNRLKKIFWVINFSEYYFKISTECFNRGGTITYLTNAFLLNILVISNCLEILLQWNSLKRNIH